MPWKVRDEMELREQFVLDALSPGANVSALCRRYGISRKTGYKWKKLYEKRGRAGLSNRSTRPKSSPLRVSAELTIDILALRDAHPRWGPKILRVMLLGSRPADEVPSERTIARILERAGRVARRKRRCDRKSVPITRPEVEVTAPNDLWTIDFKGWWRTRNQRRFEPLTIRDAHARFVLCAQHLETTTAGTVRAAMEPILVEYGLPRAILVDNGSPFVSVRSLAGLTTLSAWWVAQGIRLVRTRLGCPQDNGGHERMHRTMAEDVEAMPRLNASLQQSALDEWRHEFNHVRPHRALGMHTPASLYTASDRPYQPDVELDYPDADAVRKVDSIGCIKLFGNIHFLSHALAGQHVALRRLDSEQHEVWFSDHVLGHVSNRRRSVIPIEDAA
jgi:transposase InsO family protein